ncbi:hypothetical protein WOSG25_140040 [Weissella oryzae SG25]|uniref:Uncharacterized protein n=1 Tax=Weissella oryzae (strain DSM 25784 / JCM 18191 / LMG 30913 / SG25) TaxID=1329250 RepID=A0A069CWE6_WEIOS|nr:hypothetical protein [Weissella oryzae]GAK31702.1 hypothetical protein WOSG25_140040 [Weissella oryzae SG25]
MNKWRRYGLNEKLDGVSNEIKKTLSSSEINYSEAFLILEAVSDDLDERQRQTKLKN